jgi:hypothetical protein
MAMKDVRMLSTSEQPCRWDIDGGEAPSALNAIAAANCRATAPVTRDDESGLFKQPWRLVEGSEVRLPVHAANALIGFGYAEEITAS